MYFMYVYIYIYLYNIYINTYIHTWNPNDPCFDWKGPSFGGLKPQNRGQADQAGSRYLVYIYIYNLQFFGTKMYSRHINVKLGKFN